MLTLVHFILQNVVLKLVYIYLQGMCRLWARIRHGVRWDRAEQSELALKAFSLKDVSAVDVQFDPFCGDSTALRQFWHSLSQPKVRETNPKIRVQAQIRSNGQLPQFTAHLQDGRKIVVKTEGFHLADMLMRVNRLLGLPQIGLYGEPEQDKSSIVSAWELERHLREEARKKRPVDFLT